MGRSVSRTAQGVPLIGQPVPHIKAKKQNPSPRPGAPLLERYRSKVKSSQEGKTVWDWYWPAYVQPRCNPHAVAVARSLF